MIEKKQIMAKKKSHEQCLIAAQLITTGSRIYREWWCCSETADVKSFLSFEALQKVKINFGKQEKLCNVFQKRA